MHITIFDKYILIVTFLVAYGFYSVSQASFDILAWKTCCNVESLTQRRMLTFAWPCLYSHATCLVPKDESCNLIPFTTLQKSLSNNTVTLTFYMWKLVPSNLSRWNYLKFHMSFILLFCEFSMTLVYSSFDSMVKINVLYIWRTFLSIEEIVFHPRTPFIFF